MDRTGIAAVRLANHHLIGRPLATAAEAVKWFAAVQSQDYAGAKWGLAQRMAPGTTDAELDELFDAGELIRTHVMRPTWHFVTPSDTRWMLDLTAARVQAQNRGRYRELGLDATTLRRGTRVIAKALAQHTSLTRSELVQALERAGIPTDGQRIPHILMNAELEQVICSGPRNGRQHTYMLLDERVPATKPRGREEALALLALRYFRSHGPATAHDFAWWSGLTVADAREGAALNADSLTTEDHDDRTYYFTPDGAHDRSRPRTPTVHLLPSFDEYLVGYRHHEPNYDEQRLGPRASLGILRNILTVDGQIVGAWKRTIRKADVLIEGIPLIELSTAERKDMERAASHYARFMGLPRAELSRT